MTEVRDRAGSGRRVRDSVLLTPGDAPGLWAMVTELATRVGTRPPDEVRAVAEASARVSEECRFPGLLAGTRRLYVGLPLLIGLTADELRAVICHELGRYARGHTRIGADAAAAATAGKAAADALRGTHALSLGLDEFLSRHAGAVLREGFVPAGLFDGFAAMLTDPLFRDVLAAWRASPPIRPAAPCDFHPGLAARLRQLSGTDGTAGDRDLTPAISLLADPRQVSRAVEAAALPAADGPALPWPQWGELAAEAHAVHTAQQLLRAARRAAAEPAPTLSTVLDLLQGGAADQLRTAMTAAGQPEPGAQPEPGDRDPLRRALAALVGCVLVQAGYASWRVSWTGPGILEGIDFPVAEFPALADAAAGSPAQAASLRDRVADLGIPLDLPLAPVRVTVPAGRPGPALRWPAADVTASGRSAGRRATAGVLMAIFAVIVLGGAIAAAIGTSAATAPPSGPARKLPVAVVAPSWPPLAAPTWPPPSLPFAPRPPFLPVRHTVQPGDTLHSLACRYFTTVRALRQANHLGPRDVLHAGQVLNIPEFSDLSRPGCG